MGQRKGPMLVAQVTPDMLTRVDKLIPKVRRNQSIVSIGRVTRSAIVRLALLRGLEALEAEYK